MISCQLREPEPSVCEMLIEEEEMVDGRVRTMNKYFILILASTARLSQIRCIKCGIGVPNINSVDNSRFE